MNAWLQVLQINLIPKQSPTTAIVACSVVFELEVTIAVVKDRGWFEKCLSPPNLLLTAWGRSVLWLSVRHLLNDIF